MSRFYYIIDIMLIFLYLLCRSYGRIAPEIQKNQVLWSFTDAKIGMNIWVVTAEPGKETIE